MNETNFNRWQVLHKNVTSPQIWIDFGFYFLVGAALQRRVWFYGTGDSGAELFPNQYICFVGKPGLGKGAVTRPVARLLRYHKFELGNLIKTNIGTEKPALFAVGADSTTFEQLLDDLADSIRRVARPNNQKPYVHTSCAFCLEELDSLFKRKTQDVAAFLKNAYDCGQYEYKTRHQAKHNLRSLCVSLLAGTQPDFFITAQKTGLFGEGFASRTLFLFANERRFSRFHNTTLDEEQKTKEAEILNWIKKLATAYGEVTYDKETHEFLEDWEKNVHAPREITAHPRMQEYLARKKVIMLKLAMAIHFGEEISYTIPLNTFKQAIAILDSQEESMSLGLGCTGRNPLHGYQVRIKEYITAKQVASEREIILRFIHDVPPADIKTILETLEQTKQIVVKLAKGEKLYAFIPSHA